MCSVKREASKTPTACSFANIAARKKLINNPKLTIPCSSTATTYTIVNSRHWLDFWPKMWASQVCEPQRCLCWQWWTFIGLLQWDPSAEINRFRPSKTPTHCGLASVIRSGEQSVVLERWFCQKRIKLRQNGKIANRRTREVLLIVVVNENTSHKNFCP